MKKSLIILFVISTYLFGQIKSGWWIFRRPQSTKPKSVTAVTAVRGDLSGVLYNPSILATVRRSEIFLLTEIIGLANDTFGGVIYGQPIKRNTALACGLIYYDAGKTTLYWIENGQEQEETVTIQRDILGLISCGRAITPKLLAGMTLKTANSTIAERSSAYAFALDLGMLYLPLDKLSLSFAVQNLGMATKFEEESNPLPTSMWFGAFYDIKLGNTFLGVGFDLPYIFIDNKLFPSIGIELTFKGFSINFGYRFNVKDAVVHFGFGIMRKKFDFGYAYIPARYLTHTHRITFGFRF